MAHRPENEPDGPPAPLSPPPQRPPEATRLGDVLEQFVTGQRSRIRRRFLIHGLGWMAALLAAVTLIYYGLDWTLGLPPLVRILVSLGAVAFLVSQIRRRVLYSQRAHVHRDDVAVVLERRFPELREQLISAVQLKDSMREGGAGLRNQSEAMIEQVLRHASAEVDKLDESELLDAQRTTTLWAAAFGLSLALGITAALNPQAFGVFLQRIVGADTTYPRLTTLHVELPASSHEHQIEIDGRTARVTMAAGDDLPVLVRVEGKVPATVVLKVTGGRGVAPRIAMTARGPDRFRHMFRRVSSSFKFHAAGGDDDRGDMTVEVTTVRPPRVGGVRATLTYPAYTAREPITQAGGSLEALEGTRVQIQIAPTAEVSSGSLTFLESGLELPLVRETVMDDEGSREVLNGEFVVERSDRYQVRLVSPGGLKNPHPGTYPVVAVPDQAPSGRILTPADDNLALVLPTGVVPFRLSARDDYGLAAAHAVVRVGKSEQEARFPLLEDAPDETDPATAARLPTRTVVTRLFDVANTPSPGTGAAIGDIVNLGATLTDNKEPGAHATEIPARQMHVVGPAHLATRISGHFRRIREAVEDLRDRQGTSTGRLQEVLEELGAGAARSAVRNDITAVQVAQARVQSGTNRVHIDFMRAFDVHLFNRLDDSPHAGRALELYASYHGEHREPTGFLPGFYEMIGTERREGRLGPMTKTLDPILEMTLTCARIGQELAPQTTKLLDRAMVAASLDGAKRTLEDAARRQTEIGADLEKLADMLAEWNDFQDVITQTRAVLEKQREVQVRTRDQARDRGRNDPGKKGNSKGGRKR